MAKEFFQAHFFRARSAERNGSRTALNYYLSCQFFNAFPLPQREAGTRQTLRYIGEVARRRLLDPDLSGGQAHEDAIGPFRPGIGMIGARLGVPVVPVRIEGLDKVLHPKYEMADAGPVRVAFGAPMRLTGDDYAGFGQESGGRGQKTLKSASRMRQWGNGGNGGRRGSIVHCLIGPLPHAPSAMLVGMKGREFEQGRSD